SVFFHDLLLDLPLQDAVGYVFNYQRQYPALGLTFWPPLFHAVTGSLMLIFGPSFFTVKLAMAGFVLLFVLSLWLTASRSLTTGWGLIAVALTCATPLVMNLSNTIMLELPSLAMGFLLIACYRRITLRGEWKHWSEAVLIGILGAAMLYTKQPALFVLVALTLDILFGHRHFLKDKRTWLAAATLIVLLMPLVAFTLKYGAVNIAQSIGNQGNIYVEHHRVAARWSVEGWTYY
ncbi:MAG: glycosyltransferase family 39 protein, partial [Planctomycetaceae bacterium]|nr:glycosyltransferase family 39 protein [Planctomycetaceae bacterium]